MKKRFKRAWSWIWERRGEFAWGVFQGVIGGAIGLLMVTLYLRGR